MPIPVVQQTLATILYSINTPPYALVPVNIIQKKSISSGSSITNLTGTTWYFNASPNVSMQVVGPLELNFISNNTNYVGIRYGKDGPETFIRYKLPTISSDIAYQDGTWTNQAYRTITITGGADATNSTLISWLQSEATFVSGDSFQPVLASHIGTSVATIQFRIGSVIYQAEEDMTWYEWVNSDYNTGGYTCPNASQYIHSTNLSNYMVGKGSNYIRSNYIITPNCAYTLIGGGAGN